jgi:hypothetical protein
MSSKIIYAQRFIEKSTNIHNGFYDYSKAIYTKAREKIEIICPIHGAFWQTADSHIHGIGCMKCSHDRNKSLIYNNDSVIQKFKDIHNDTYDYSLVEYTGCKNKVKIICKDHGIFLQTPDKHISGNGCKKCAIIYRANLQKNSREYILEQFKKVHGDTYDYSNFIEYKNSSTKIEIICKDHGVFSQSPSSHITGNGCKKCAVTELANKKRHTMEKVLLKFEQVHGNTYDYSNFIEYKNNYTKIEIICKTHGSFFQTFDSHSSGQGCPMCPAARQYSIISHLWLDSIDNNIIKEYKLPENPKRKVDGYDPNTNTIYQFHGDFYHGNPEIYPSDKINTRTKSTFGELYNITLLKDQQLRDYGYNLIIMWESDWNRSLGKKIYPKY